MNYQYSNPDQYGGYDETKQNNIYTTNQECSSGCESGWTHYLDDDNDSSVSPRNNESMTHSSSKNRFVKKEAYQEEDEDLSMVSDASSGPPHFLDQEDNSRLYQTEDLLSRNRRKTKEKRRSKVKDHHHQSSLLDDTASSPLFDHSNKNFNMNRSQPTIREDVMIEYSQGYSTTQFEARPPYHEHYDFFQSGNQLQQNQWF